MDQTTRVSRRIALPLFALSALMMADSWVCASVGEAAIGLLGLFAALVLCNPQRHVSQTPLPFAG